jgi:hypothetical protein
MIAPTLLLSSSISSLVAGALICVSCPGLQNGVLTGRVPRHISVSQLNAQFRSIAYCNETHAHDEQDPHEKTTEQELD